jgi:acetolactate synthase-1/3 small subunit
MKKDDDRTYTLTLTVRNHPGVLTRCAQIFSRRGHNIESLHVSTAKTDTHLSTMVITAYGQPGIVSQVVAQLGKLVDVVEISEEGV